MSEADTEPDREVFMVEMTVTRKGPKRNQHGYLDTHRLMTFDVEASPGRAAEVFREALARLVEPEVVKFLGRLPA